jgi:hypothetical protein
LTPEPTPMARRENRQNLSGPRTVALRSIVSATIWPLGASGHCRRPAAELSAPPDRKNPMYPPRRNAIPFPDRRGFPETAVQMKVGSRSRLRCMARSSGVRHIYLPSAPKALTRDAAARAEGKPFRPAGFFRSPRSDAKTKGGRPKGPQLQPAANWFTRRRMNSCPASNCATVMNSSG